MPGSSRKDPFKDYAFIVEIDGIPSAAFTEVSGLTAEAQVIEYREGGDPINATRKLPGRIRYGDVTLKRGLTTSRDLFDWWTTVATGNIQRRNVAIILLNDARQEVMRWRLHEAWIAKIEASSLRAGGNEVVIESVVLTHEGLELDTPT